MYAENSKMWTKEIEDINKWKDYCMLMDQKS